jgi:transposase
LPDLTFTDLLQPADPLVQRVLDLLPDADLYLQDEVYIAVHPTLTRVWCRRGRRGQRRVPAPGQNAKKCGFGLVDWRAGWFDWASADKRAAAPFCAQLRRAVERSQARGRTAIVLLDNLGIHTPRRSKLLRALLEEDKDNLLLVSTPTYDPDANRIEWLWRALRAAVTHNHQRHTLEELLGDATVWADALTPAEVLAHIGSPFADGPASPEELKHAA